MVPKLRSLVRAPSDEVAERARHAEEIAFFGGFLKNYAAAGGTVLAEKPHGGSELYPRGVLLKGELLSTFERTPVGEVFVARVTSADSNLLAGFYGYPPIFVGGSYFNLERPFNYSLYRCTYLIRKDSEKSGALLMARLEVAQ